MYTEKNQQAPSIGEGRDQLILKNSGNLFLKEERVIAVKDLNQ